MECKFCKRIGKNPGGNAAHERTCKQNPNRVKHTRSPLAGAKKGSIPYNKGAQLGRGKHWDIKFPLESVMVENSSYSRTNLRKRIIDLQLIPYTCSICNCSSIWQGKPMPLILDHINGVNNDHRLENLRFICSNCDSQLDTYKSRNIKKF